MTERDVSTLIGIGLPVAVLFFGSVILFAKTKAIPAFLQLLGAGGLIVVVVAHIAEALNLVPWMQWGHDDSFGHYLDLAGAVAGLTLFPAGYLLHALAPRPA